MMMESVFQQFMFWNPVKLHVGTHPGFWVASWVDKDLAGLLGEGRAAS